MQSLLSTVTGAAPLAAELALKGFLWLGAIFLITAALRNASASTRHLVWCVGIAGLFLLPVLSNRMTWRIAVPLAVAPDAHRAQLLEPTSGAPTLPSAAAPGRETTGAVAAVSSSGTAQDEPRQSAITALPAPIPVSVLLLVAWSAGALLLLLRLALSVRRVRHTVVEARTTDEQLSRLQDALAQRLGIERRVRLVLTSRTAIPFTTGIIRPVVVLPTVARHWEPEKIEAVLLHELAHIARYDLATSFAAHVACAAFWFNPLVWVASQRMRIEAERACDDAVLRSGTRASDYADQLLEVVRETQLRWAPAVAVAMARRSAFEGRVLAILSPDTNRRRLTPRIAAAVSLGIALVALPIAAMRPAGQPPLEPVASAVESDDPQDAQSQDAQSQEEQQAPRAAAEAVTQDTQPRAATVRALVSALRDSDDGVRLAAIQSLASRDVRQVVPELLPALSDASVDVRRAVAEALSQMQDPRAIAALVQALRTDTDPQVREMAAQALGHIDDESAVPGLLAAWREERVTAVRRQIIDALAGIGSASSASALMDALRDGDAEIRASAVNGLGAIEYKAAAPQIIPLLRDANADVRHKAAWALGALKAADALDELMTAAADANAEVRQAALHALDELETPRALPAFIRALRDARVDVRRQAASAIGDIEGLDRAPRELVAALDDADAEMRQTVLHALGHIHDVSTISAIIPFTRATQPFDVREAAIEALGEFERNAQVEAVLLELMRDADPKVRRLAAQGLGRD
jgi:HEAT repeat protein/beta-lactamase regulating signal transducer with metallopeptidase domain